MPYPAVFLSALVPAVGFIAALRADAGDWSPPAAASGPVDFVRDVQPIFANHCYSCHGPKRQESAFRLDLRADALKGGDAGAAIAPGKAAESPLLQHVAGKDGYFMPPKGERLTGKQVGILRRWIDDGAVWPDEASGKRRDARNHWAFKAPQRPALPKVSNVGWGRTAIDRFILARLEKEGMAPSPEADRITLIRRLSLDLVGLPPTTAEVDAFVADRRPDAYARVVEKLLASPHYGERWARHWLDAARYADSDGYEKDKSRQVWFYRDWVVGALNRDLPYDRFIVEQIAGDLIPGATQDQIVATGFLRNSMINEEGGVDPEQFRMDAMFDRMECIGKSVLGLTIQCAQCHTHKFDPIAHEEYYRLFAYLNNDHEAQRVVYAAEERRKIADLRREMAAIENELRMRTPDWAQRMAAWEKALPKSPDWKLLKLENAGDNGQRYLPQEDGSILCAGYAPTKTHTHFRGPSPIETIGAFRVELLNDPNLPCNGPGRSFMGTCALSEFTVEATSVKDPKKKANVKFKRAAADYGNPVRDLEANFDDKSKKKRVTGPVDYAIDGKDDTAWGIDQGPGRRNAPHEAIFIPEKPVGFPGGTILDVHVKQLHGGWNSDDHMNNNFGRFRLTAAATAPTADPLPPAVQSALAKPAAQRSEAATATVFSHWRKTVADFKQADAAIEALWKQWPAGSTALTLASREMPRDTRLLKRGDFLKPANPVGAGVPAALHSLKDPNAPATRLTFAEWLVDPRSPTTARVLVNRVWQQYFGIGLVTSAEDFGTQSDAPSHPELLDWLATEFMANGWSVKHLHRLIVGSATYRQSSRIDAAASAADPYNRLLARFPRQRVEGEIVRDIALAASGRLDPKVGGPAIFSPAPAFLFQPPASYGPFVWTQAKGSDRYRRGLYTFRRRSTPYPMLTNFDSPNGDASCVRRVRSNTPLQALTTLNEEVFLECAQGLAEKTLKEGGKTDEERLKYAFRRCVARPPAAEDLADLQSLLDKQRARIKAGKMNASLVATGVKDAKPRSDGVAYPELAAYVVVARALLNLDETIARE